MATVCYELPGPRPLVIPAQAADALLASGRGDAALLYLHILRKNGVLRLPEAAAALNRSQQETEALAQTLCEMGLLTRHQGDKPAPEVTPVPAKEDLDRVMAASGEDFAGLVEDVSQLLDKVLSGQDTMTLVNIYSALGLPREVILLLVTHCCQRTAEKSGPGRKPTLRAIEREAYRWEREGLLTLEAAEEYLRGETRRETALEAFAHALNLENQTISETMRSYMLSWAGMGFDPEAAALAYDITLTNTGKLNWKYMDSILNRWHQNGLHRVPEIQAGDAPGGSRYRKDPGRQVTAADVRRNRDARNKIEGS